MNSLLALAARVPAGVAAVSKNGDAGPEGKHDADQGGLHASVGGVEERMPAEGGDVAGGHDAEVVVAETAETNALLKAHGAGIHDDGNVVEDKVAELRVGLAALHESRLVVERFAVHLIEGKEGHDLLDIGEERYAHKGLVELLGLRRGLFRGEHDRLNVDLVEGTHGFALSSASSSNVQGSV